MSITTQNLETIQITSQIYTLHIDTYTDAAGEVTRHYVLRSPKYPSKHWVGVHTSGYMATELEDGAYTFQTVAGAKLKRAGKPLKITISGGNVTRLG